MVFLEFIIIGAFLLSWVILIIESTKHKKKIDPMQEILELKLLKMRKLERLKKLYNKDLITEEEYEQKQRTVMVAYDKKSLKEIV